VGAVEDQMVLKSLTPEVLVVVEDGVKLVHQETLLQ
jgi:hypothetical protein